MEVYEVAARPLSDYWQQRGLHAAHGRERANVHLLPRKDCLEIFGCGHIANGMKSNGCIQGPDASEPDGSIRHGYATELMFPPRDPGHVETVWPMGRARFLARGPRPGHASEAEL